MENDMKKPNILFILSDQHNARMSGAYGDTYAKTPALNSLARDGITFDRAYTVSPICSPSRMSIYTGKRPSEHGLYGNVNWVIDYDCPEFLPRLLRENGYETSLIGRSHMVRALDQESFDYVSYMDFGDCDRYDISDNQWLKSLIDNGVADAFDLSIPDSLAPNGSFISQMPLEFCEESWMADTADKYLRTRDKSKPFYMHVAYDRPHDPISPVENFANMFDPAEVPLPKNWMDTYDGKPEHLREIRYSPEGYPYTPRDEAHAREMLARQYALVAQLDYSIDRIIRSLKESGDLENTVIIYTSDHGEFAGEHGMFFKNAGINDCVHRVPLIIRYPDGDGAGSRCDEIVESIDLYARILSCAGSAHPDERLLDLSAVATGNAAGRDYAICDMNDYASITTKTHRLVYYWTHKDGELYDLSTDPGELVNLWDVESHVCLRDDLLDIMIREIREDQRVITTFPDRPEDDRVKNWYKQDSPIYALWYHGIRYSQLKPYMVAFDGGYRLTVDAAEIAANLGKY